MSEPTDLKRMIWPPRLRLSRQSHRSSTPALTPFHVSERVPTAATDGQPCSSTRASSRADARRADGLRCSTKCCTPLLTSNRRGMRGTRIGTSRPTSWSTASSSAMASRSPRAACATSARKRLSVAEICTKSLEDAKQKPPIGRGRPARKRAGRCDRRHGESKRDTARGSDAQRGQWCNARRSRRRGRSRGQGRRQPAWSAKSVSART